MMELKGKVYHWRHLTVDDNIRITQVQTKRRYEMCKMYLLSLVHTMLVIMLVVLRMVTQEQLATFVHVSKDYAS